MSVERERVPAKVLFAHTPKAGGLHLIEYFRDQLAYPMIQSSRTTEDGVWVDFQPEELDPHLGAERAFLATHTLISGWSDLVELIPPATRDVCVERVRAFRARGWFTFTFVRHPGDLRCSFYFYIHDAYERVGSRPPTSTPR